MPFLPPNQQRQSTEGKCYLIQNSQELNLQPFKPEAQCPNHLVTQLSNKQWVKTNLFDRNKLILMDIGEIIQLIKEVLTTSLLHLYLIFPLLPSRSKMTLS